MDKRVERDTHTYIYIYRPNTYVKLPVWHMGSVTLIFSPGSARLNAQLSYVTASCVSLR